MLMGAFAYAIFALECTTFTDGFLVFRETSNTHRVPFISNQVSLNDTGLEFLICDFLIA